MTWVMEFMGKYVVVHVDDILIHRKDKIQNREHLTNVFKVLHDNQL